MEACSTEACSTGGDLALLHQLGFEDDEQNKQALDACQGDLRAALQMLINTREPTESSSSNGYLEKGAAALWEAGAALVGNVLGGTEPVEEEDISEGAAGEESVAKVGWPGRMSNSSVCAECKSVRFFAPYNPDAEWYGLSAPNQWGLTRRHHCRNCRRSVCAACSPNKLPLKVFNVPERVCNRCWKLLRPSALSVAGLQQLQATHKQTEDDLSKLKAEKENLVREKAHRAALIQDAEKAAQTLQASGAPQATTSAELEALKTKCRTLEQEHRAAEEVSLGLDAAMAKLKAQLESEEAAHQHSAEQVQPESPKLPVELESSAAAESEGEEPAPGESEGEEDEAAEVAEKQ